MSFGGRLTDKGHQTLSPSALQPVTNDLLTYQRLSYKGHRVSLGAKGQEVST
jgi:hypothetical protein